MYSMNSRLKIAKQASQDIEIFLRKKANTVNVINVENEPDYQKKDVDLVWEVRNKKTHEIRRFLIEIKGDNYEKTGNLFLETISNKSKNTPGCFLYTEADYIFYYFVKIKKLYVLPMPSTREWFEENINQFEEKETKTNVGSGHYVTVGRLVPIKKVLDAGLKVQVFDL